MHINTKFHKLLREKFIKELAYSIDMCDNESSTTSEKVYWNFRAFIWQKLCDDEGASILNIHNLEPKTTKFPKLNNEDKNDLNQC